MRLLRKRTRLRVAQFLASVWFWLCRPSLWHFVAAVRVFRLLVWLEDPWANWWWVHAMGGKRLTFVRRVSGPDR